MFGSGIPTHGGEVAIETTPENKFPVEIKKRLCDSITWEMLKNYYTNMSIDAWSHNYVPSFVTSNSRLARSYARIILNYMKDWYKNNGTEDKGPVYILEIGAGHGRFTYLVINALLRYKHLFPSLGLPEHPFVYLFSDIAEANISFCNNHLKLKKYIDEGWLDFCYFDGNTTNTTINLINNGKSIPHGSPITIIANYVLDSLLTDAWRIDENGNFFRSLISVYSPLVEEDFTNPDIMTRMTLRWDWEPVDIEVESNANSGLKSEYLKNKKIVEVLNKYKSFKQSMSFVLPVGAFQLFDTLHTLSNGNLMFLVGDKGYPSWNEFVGNNDPHIAVHGSMSFMVNLHAIKLYFDFMGGFNMTAPYKDTFQVTCLWACGPKENFGCSQAALIDDLEDMNPDSLLNLQRVAVDTINNGGTVGIKHILALLRYSGHDPDVLWNLRQQLSNQCIITNPRLEHDILQDIDKVYENWYQLRNDEDVPDLCGQLCMRLRKCDKAIYYFKKSLVDCSSTIHPSTYINIAACYKVASNIPKALEYCNQALVLDPRNTDAIELNEKLVISSNPIKLAFIGCGLFTMYECLPLFRQDTRCKINALFAFDAQQAEELKSAYFLKNAVVYKGSEELHQLLSSPDIDACIVDVHPNIMASMLQKIWKYNKHVLTRSPFSFSVTDAFKLIEEYKVYKSNLSWYSISPHRLEHPFLEANSHLRKLGNPISFSVQYVSNSGIDMEKYSMHNLYNDSEYLATELFKCLSSLNSITGEQIQSICSHYVPVIHQENAKVGTKLKDMKEADQDYPAPKLLGWCKLSNSNYPDGSNGLIGSFMVTHHASDNILKYEIYCTGGYLKLKKTSTAWIMKIRVGDFKETEVCLQSVGHQYSHDAWLSQIAMHKKNYNPTDKSFVEFIKIKEITQLETVIDCALMQGILFSIKNYGSVISFEYYNKNNNQESIKIESNELEMERNMTGDYCTKIKQIAKQ